MLDDIKQANRRQCPRQHAGILKSRAYYVPQTALDSIPDTCKTRLHQHRINARVLNRLCHIPVSAADIEEHSARGK